MAAGYYNAKLAKAKQSRFEFGENQEIVYC